MSNRLTNLGFIIGLFFTLVSIILLVGYFTSATLASTLNLYAGFAFLAFGLLMMWLPGSTNRNKQ